MKVLNEYAEASKRFRALARTAELVAHRMVTEHDRNTAVTLSVLAALGLEETRYDGQGAGPHD